MASRPFFADVAEVLYAMVRSWSPEALAGDELEHLAVELTQIDANADVAAALWGGA